jgi:hypothetical protein
MRAVSLLFLVFLAGCVTPSASRIDARTFVIDNGGVANGSSAPNRRLAEELCPNGYRVLDTSFHRNGPNLYRTENGFIWTYWTIRCL